MGELESRTKVEGIVLARNIKDSLIEEDRLALGFKKSIGFR